MPATPIKLYIPDDLFSALSRNVSESHTIQAEILSRLARSCRVKVDPPKRGRRWPKKEPTRQ